MKSDILSRQIKVIGRDNQAKISSKVITLIGAGGLGSPIALYLSRIGIKKLNIIDYDIVEKSNLSRQVLYEPKDLNQDKIKVASNKLSEFCVVKTSKEINEDMIKESNLVIGGVDNWSSRYKLNDLCIKNKVPLIDIAVEGSKGHIMWINDNSPCLKCVFSKNDLKRTIPIINTTCLFAASLALNQIFNFLIEDNDNIDYNKIIYFDSKNSSIEKFNIKKNPKCIYCGEKNEN